MSSEFVYGIRPEIMCIHFSPPTFKFEDQMALPSTTVMLGLEMANPASSHGMDQVLQTFPKYLPVLNRETGARQPTLVGCDQNFFERGSAFYFVM